MVAFPCCLTLATLATLAVAQQCADPTGAVKDTISALSSLDDKLDSTSSAVESFDKSQGVAGALSIQSNEGEIESAADDVTKKSGAMTDLDDCDSKALAAASETTGNKIISLLDALSKKQSDLSAVGTADIVKSDLSSLEKKLGQFMTNAYQKSTCAGVDLLAPTFDKVNSAYSDAFKAYGGSSTGAVSKPANCRNPGSSGSASAGPNSGTPASGAAGSSVATSAAKASTSGSGSVAGTGLPPTTPSTTDVAATATGITQPTDMSSAVPSVVPSNQGSSLASSGLGAIVAGLAAGAMALSL